MTNLNLATKEWLEQLQNADMCVQEEFLSELNQISPLLIKCASLNSCEFGLAKNPSTVSRTDTVPRSFSSTEAFNESKTEDDMKRYDSFVDIKINKVTKADENETLEEKAFLILKTAQQLYEINKYEEALTYYNQAISYYSISPLLYARRAQTFLKLKKPMNCINDCSSALAIAPDHALARKFRGRAYMLMGQWDKAISDLLMVEDDVEVNEWMDKILPIINKLDNSRNIQQTEDEKLSQTDNIGEGDNFIHDKREIQEEMQDPEVLDALEKCPKIKKLFKKMMKMLKDDLKFNQNEGDVGFSYLSNDYVPSDPETLPMDIDETSYLNNKIFPFNNDNERWLQSLKRYADIQNITEDEVGLHEKNTNMDELDMMYPVKKSSRIFDDSSD